MNGVRVLIPFTDAAEFDKALALVSDPQNNAMLSDMAEIFKSFNVLIDKVQGKQIELVMTVDPGVHGWRSNPDVVGHELYAINPMAVTNHIEVDKEFIKLMNSGYDSDTAMASNLTHVLVHEYTHNYQKDHYESFTTAFGQVYMKMTHGQLARLEEQGRVFYENNGTRIKQLYSDLEGMGKRGTRLQDSSLNVQSPSQRDTRGEENGSGIPATGERGEVGQREIDNGEQMYQRDGRPYRTFAVDGNAGKIITSYYKSDKMKAHPDYVAAKAGDREAAARLVVDVVKPETIEAARERFGPDVIYAAPHAEEASGRNQIPNALANIYASQTSGRVDDSIIQAVRAFHTGAGAMDRLISRALFDGDIVKGGKYVLVDDVSTMGGTFAEMSHHIQANGGTVVGIITLTNASRSTTFTAKQEVTNEIERRYGNEVRELFGIDPKSLTAAEAGYLVGFRDANSLRNRAVKARQERVKRLLSKGIRTPEVKPQQTERTPQVAREEVGQAGSKGGTGCKERQTVYFPMKLSRNCWLISCLR